MVDNIYEEMEKRLLRYVDTYSISDDAVKSEERKQAMAETIGKKLDEQMKICLSENTEVLQMKVMDRLGDEMCRIEDWNKDIMQSMGRIHGMIPKKTGMESADMAGVVIDTVTSFGGIYAIGGIISGWKANGIPGALVGGGAGFAAGYMAMLAAVGPNQFPEIYEMTVDCAKRLGIGVPNVFVENNPVMNAYTIASDDVSPIIVLYSGIIERLTPGELKCVIAHECGHIHNQHAIYKVVVDEILNSGTGKLGAILSTANIALMQFWTRAGEITADRAALICADNVEEAENVNKKLLYGAMMNTDYQVNVEALREQLEVTLNNPTKIVEVLSDHPNSIRRVLAEREFEECEVFYKWRPELKRPGMIMRTKEATEIRCKKLVNILDNK